MYVGIRYGITKIKQNYTNSGRSNRIDVETSPVSNAYTV
jgi:hypothetical protein